MMSASFGSMATPAGSPMANEICAASSEDCRSNSGRQLAPPSVVFHTPPQAAPM